MDTAVSAPSIRSRSKGRIVAASFIGILALLLLATGGAGLWARYGTSDHGWIASGTHAYSTSGRAVVSGALDADGIPNWLVAKARINAASADGKPLFIGVARSADVEHYLAGVAHSTVEDVNFSPFKATYSSVGGATVPARPAAQTFWVRSTSGTGKQTLSWNLRNGSWRVVVMNSDASPRVVAEAKAAVTFRGELAIAFSALGAGLALAAAAVALGVGARRFG